MQTFTKKSEKNKKKKVLRLLSLNINERDLSIGLVMLKEFALLSKEINDNYEIHIHQWNKNYANKGQANTLEGLDLDALLEELDPEGTDIFGFSMYTWNNDFMLTLAEKMKAKNPRALMLFGGSQAGGYGARLLEKYSFVDYVIKGEAEYSFRAFLLGLLENDVTYVENLFYRSNNEIKTTVSDDPKVAKKMSYLKTLEEIPFAFRSQEYRDFLDNLDHQVTAQFETERGCPLSCAFCSWGTRLPIRRRKPEDIKEGLLYLLNHPNVKAVYVVDANPFIKNSKGLWLSEFLLNENHTGKPVYFELNPEYIRDERVIENLGKLQGDELAFGLQSTSDITLKTIKRKFSRDIYERNVKRLRDMNPEANIKFSLILGLPGDNYHSFTNSLSFVIGMRPKDIYVHDLLILPGSEMYDDPEQFGLEIDRDPPHYLVNNKAFPWKEINQAKRLGFYTKLIHKYTWLRDELFKLHSVVGGRYVDLYYDYINWINVNGVDALDGQDIGQVSSEEFDFRTEKFMNKSENKRLLKSLFLTFRESVKLPQAV